MLSRWDERTPYLGLSAIWFAIPMILGMALLAYFAIRRAMLQPPHAAVASAIVLVLILAALTALSYGFGVQLRPYALPAAFALFTLQLLLGVPIGFVLLMATLVYLSTSHAVPLSVVPINMQSGISSFVMLSIPFFILAGYVMTEGGLSRALDRLRHRAGRARARRHAAGHRGLDVHHVGHLRLEGRRRRGGRHHDEERDAPRGLRLGETAAVLAACAIMGETVPPSIAMLVLASVTSLSIGALFVAGLLPAAVIALCLMVLIYVRSRNRPVRAKSHSRREIARAGLDAIPAAGCARDPDRRHRQRRRDADRGVVDRRRLCAAALDRRLSLARRRPGLARDGEHRRAGRHGAVHHLDGQHVLVVADHRQAAAVHRGAVQFAARIRDGLHAGDRRHAGGDGSAAGGAPGAPDLRPAAAADGRPVRDRSASVRHRHGHRDGRWRLLAADRGRHVRDLLDLRHHDGERERATCCRTS